MNLFTIEDFKSIVECITTELSINIDYSVIFFLILEQDWLAWQQSVLCDTYRYILFMGYKKGKVL